MKKNKIAVIFMALVGLVAITFIIFGFVFTNNLKPVSNKDEIVVVEVEENATTKQVLQMLENKGVIKDGDLTYYYVRFMHPVNFFAGKYEVNKIWDFNHIIDYLSNSDNIVDDTVSITFIEGEWLKHYARSIAEATNVKEDELLSFWNDEEAIRSLMSEYPFLTEEIFNEDSRLLLEGYLFPDTYMFFRETNPLEVTRTFLDRSYQIYKENETKINESELSIHELFTLASIVQYEGTDAQNMKDIAGVFYNRLNEGMPLQSSVTICYAIDVEDGDWKQCEYNIDYDSPYNTYKYQGLPPGPILNPSQNAFLAVLEPSEHNYLYFLADVCGDGTVYFAEDFTEHEENVSKYLTCY